MKGGSENYFPHPVTSNRLVCGMARRASAAREPAAPLCVCRNFCHNFWEAVRETFSFQTVSIKPPPSYVAPHVLRPADGVSWDTLIRPHKECAVLSEASRWAEHHGSSWRHHTFHSVHSQRKVERSNVSVPAGQLSLRCYGVSA